MTPQQIDTSLNTSFAQRSPVPNPVGVTPPARPKGTPLFLYLGLFVFVVGGLFSGGVYFFHGLVAQDVADLEQQLTTVQQVIDLENLNEIEKVDARLKLTQSVFGSHRVSSPLFRFLEDNTISDVSYSNFSYGGGGGAGIVLTGEAASYEAIAQQSDILSASPLAENHIFSGFRLSENGRVSFNLVIEPVKNLTRFVKE